MTDFASIQLDVGAATTGTVSQLRLTTLNEYEAAKAFVDQFNGTYGARSKAFETKASTSATHTESGIRYEVKKHGGVPADHATRIVRNMKVCLAQLSKCGDHRLGDYPITIYLDEKPGSAGYVVRPSARAPMEIHVFIGTDVYGDPKTTLTGIVGNYLFKSGVAVGTLNVADTRVTALLLHEFGHVLHQLHSPTHYFGLGQLTILGDKGDSEYGYAPKPVYVEPRIIIFNRAKVRQAAREEHEKAMASWQNVAAFTDRMVNRLKYFGGDGPGTIRAFAKGASEYASRNMGSYAARMPEVVAEGFCAQMMGVSLGAELTQLYGAYGGYTPSGEMALATDQVKLRDIKEAFAR